MSDLSHRDLCRLTAGWLLARPWANMAGDELSLIEGRPDAVAVSAAWTGSALSLVSDRYEAWAEEWERRQREHAKSDRTGPPPRPPYQPTFPRATTPTIAIAEVKRTRADLLADLRAGKMLAYEERASFCYLAATPAALAMGSAPVQLQLDGTSRPANFDDQADHAISDLTERGLPRTWGVLLLTPSALNLDHWSVRSLRPARRLREVSDAEVTLMTLMLGRALAYRVCEGRDIQPDEERPT